MTVKQLQQMQLHDTKFLETHAEANHWVQRVPNGWIYWLETRMIPESRRLNAGEDSVSISISGVFVPES